VFSVFTATFKTVCSAFFLTACIYLFCVILAMNIIFVGNLHRLVCLKVTDCSL